MSVIRVYKRDLYVYFVPITNSDPQQNARLYILPRAQRYLSLLCLLHKPVYNYINTQKDVEMFRRKVESYVKRAHCFYLSADRKINSLRSEQKVNSIAQQNVNFAAFPNFSGHFFTKFIIGPRHFFSLMLGEEKKKRYRSASRVLTGEVSSSNGHILP